MTAEFIATAALRATLLLGLGLVALRWLPVERPQLRRSVALFCLAASLVVPFLPAWSSSGLAPRFLGRLPAIAPMTVDVVPVAGACAVIWLVGGVLAALRLVLRGLALRRWMGACEPLRAPVPLSVNVPVLVCSEATAPCVAGFLRPVLIVPTRATEWDDETWRCVLAHELQHVRQGDLWLGWISHAVRVLHWWNPLAWKLSRSAGFECEACCDDAVLRLGVRATDYARVLLRFTAIDDAPQPAGFFINGKTSSALCRRVERLLGSAASQVSVWRVTAVISLLVVGMAGCVWFGFEKWQGGTSQESDLHGEAALRWQANPFPADDR